MQLSLDYNTSEKPTIETFLQKVVREISERHHNDIRNVCLVLPSRRAGVFVKKYIAQHFKKTLWAPTIITIHELIEEWSEQRIIDGTSLLFEFYEVYTAIEAETAEPFDKYNKWAGILLSDFEEIDRYMIPAQQIFSDLRDIKSIEEWSFNNEELTFNQEQYLSFWNKLYTYYEKLNERLEEQGWTYQGKAYHKVANNATELVQQKKWDKIYLAGFNALSNAEKKIVKAIEEEDAGEIFWDVDTYYTENRLHEAGLFFRKFKKENKGKKVNGEENHFKDIPKEIDIIGVPQHVGQAKVAGDIIAELMPKTQLQQTALVLADESLLQPVLNSLPEELNAVNITMGFPLKFTPMHGVFNALFSLQKGRQKVEGVVRYYHRDFLKLLNHPIIKTWMSNVEGIDPRVVLQQLYKDNKPFLSQTEIQRLLGKEYEVLNEILGIWETIPTDPLKAFAAVIELLKNFYLEQPEYYQLEMEYAYHYSKIIKRLQTLFEKYPYVIDSKTFHTIFNQTVNASGLAFFGEPLQGLQLMGMLETRTLDFDTIIMLSVNEDILPKSKTENSFIPYDVKSIYGLPTYKERDAIYANHFYRLIQRARKVYLLHSTEGDNMGGGEKSRFLTQLAYELPLYNPDTVLRERKMALPMNLDSEQETVIEKSEDIIQKLDALMQHGLSPSALNTYLNCPLDFYYRYVLGLKEKEEIEEVIALSSSGTFVHETLELLYQPFIGKALTVEAVEEMKKNAEATMKQQFLTSFSESDFRYGKNHLIYRISLKFILRFLDFELQQLKKSAVPLHIKALEETLSTQITITTAQGDRTVRLKGNADRIDQNGSVVRVIDYKTGATVKRDVTLKEMEGVGEGAKSAKSLQLLMYGLIYSRMHPEVTSFTSGIYSLRTLSEGLLNVKVGKTDVLDEALLTEFEAVLKDIIASIYDEDIPFKHNHDSTWCKFCN